MILRSASAVRSPVRTGLPLWLLTLFTLLAVGAWFAWNATIDYQTMFEREYTLLEIGARNRAAHITGLVRSSEVTLSNLESDLEDKPQLSVAALNALLKERVRQLPETRSLVVLDSSGRMIASSVASVIGTDASLRDYFIHLRDTDRGHASHPLFITKPFTTATGLRGVSIARSLHDHGGRFKGVAVITISLEKFGDILQSVESAEHEESVVIHENGDVIYSIPLPELFAGKNLVGGIGYTQHMASGKATTRHRGIGKNRSRDMVLVFHKVPGTPLIVISARPYADIIAPWQQSVLVRAAGLVVIAIFLLFLTHLAGRRQAALRRERDRNQLYLDTVQSIILALDEEGRVTMINASGARMLGYAPEALTGRNWFLDMLPQPEGKEAVLPEFRLVMQGEKVLQEFLEGEVVKADGSRITVAWHHALLRDAGGRIFGSLSAGEDITQRKAHEAELLRAKEAAEAANIAKSRFLATMSHEIRTPMNGILGMAQLLQMPGINDEQRHEYAEIIVSSGNALLTLLNDILDLSKIEAGRVELDYLSFAPEQLLAEVAALYAEQARSKGLALEVLWHGEPGAHYRADQGRLQQMLANLISNAIKFTTQGFIRIEGRQIDGGAEEALLEFAVSDSGIGIPRDKQALLFKPFSQVDASTTRAYGGTGLGLSIVRNLARLMGGDAGVDSEAGQGARIWFRLQAGVVRASAAGRQPLPQAASALLPLSGERYVLVVEDVDINRMVIEAVLKQLGVRYESVVNGQEAVACILAGAAPDLVLMDCQMPVMDGYAATRSIRQWEQQGGKPHLPIIALTASAYENDRQQCLAAGMDDFIAKPLSMQELRAILEKWLPR